MCRAERRNQVAKRGEIVSAGRVDQVVEFFGRRSRERDGGHVRGCKQEKDEMSSKDEANACVEWMLKNCQGLDTGIGGSVEQEGDMDAEQENEEEKDKGTLNGLETEKQVNS